MKLGVLRELGSEVRLNHLPESSGTHVHAPHNLNRPGKSRPFQTNGYKETSHKIRLTFLVLTF